MIYSGASNFEYRKSVYANNIMKVGKYLDVSFLSELDVKKLITKPLNNQIQFEDDAFQYLMDLTNGHPFLVQIFLSYLVYILNKGKKSNLVTKVAIENGVNYAIDQFPHLFYYWNNPVYLDNQKWSDKDARLANAYKYLIITAITDNWRKSKHGLSKEELFSDLESAIKNFHQLNWDLFDEVLTNLIVIENLLQLNNYY